MINFNGQDVRLTQKQMEFLKSVASMAYGTGFREGTRGGKGNIGLCRDEQGNVRVIKFNTHFSQADAAQKAIDANASIASEELKGMLASSDALRNELRRIAVALGMSKADQEKLLGRLNDSSKLLTRRVVAEFISAAQASATASQALADIWAGGAAFTSKRDMSFRTVSENQDLGRGASQVKDFDEDAWRMYSALDSVCATGAQSNVINTGLVYDNGTLFFKQDDGKVYCKYAGDPDEPDKDGTEWKRIGASIYELRARMVHEILSVDGTAKANAKRLLDSMMEKLGGTTALGQAQCRNDGVLYLKARTKLGNDNFAGVSTKHLLDVARAVAGIEDDDGARALAKEKLLSYGKEDDIGLVNSRDSLALIRASKAEANTDKVVFAPVAGTEPQPPADASAEFRNLAADMVKLADASDVDEALDTPENERKVRDERTYIDEQMRILDLSEAALANSSEEVKSRHKTLTEKLDAHYKSLCKIPNELLARRIEWEISCDEKLMHKLWRQERTRMQDEFNASHRLKLVGRPTLKLERPNSEPVVFDVADGNKVIKVFMKMPKADGDADGTWLNDQNLQCVTLKETLKAMFNENESGIRLSFFPEGKEPEAFVKQARKFLDALNAQKPEDVRPQIADACDVVTRDLLGTVKSAFFKDGGKGELKPPAEIQKVDRSIREVFKQVQTKWKDDLGQVEGRIMSEARELLRRELLFERSPDGTEDTADGRRMLQAIASNQDALAKLIVGGEGARPCPDDPVASAMLSILARDKGLHKMLGIDEKVRRNVDSCKEKILAFVTHPTIDAKAVRELNRQVRAFVRAQVEIAQDEFSHLLDVMYDREHRHTTQFNPDNVRLIPKEGFDDVFPVDLSDVGEKMEANADKIGYGKFVKTVLMNYFKEQSYQIQLSMLSSRLRHSPAGASEGERLGAMLKGAGPLLQKILQPYATKDNPVLATALRDVKTSLNPMPQSVLQAHLLDVVNRSGGRIEKITVKRSLGCASVGQTLLCRVEGPGVQKGGLDVVVKILRPDALNMLRKERAFMMRCAKDAGMESAYASMIDKILEEFDFTIESDNVAACKVYNGKSDVVRSMDAFPLVEAAPGTLLIGLAAGKTLDAYIKEIDGIKQDYNDTYGVSSGMEVSLIGADYDELSRHIVEQRSLGTKYSHLRQNAHREHLQKIKGKIEEIRKAYDYMRELTKIWVKECCTKGGSGFYHGDLHAGNIMIDPESGITTIDMGNVSVFGGPEKSDMLALLGMCSEVPHDKVNNKVQLAPEWVHKELSKLADKFCERLLKMLAKDQAEKLTQLYYEAEKKVAVGMGKLKENYTSLKHEFMVLLSSPSLDPAPFERLSLVLKRLEERGLEIPESVSRFLSSALRLRKEVDGLLDEEKTMRILLESFVKYSMTTPKLFSILGNGFVDLNSDNDTVSSLLRPSPEMIDKHRNELEKKIKAGRPVGSPKWKHLERDIQWLQNDPIGKLFDAFKDNSTDENAMSLAKAICDYEVAEYNGLKKVFEDELGIGKRPKVMQFPRFEEIFNSVVSS